MGRFSLHVQGEKFVNLPGDTFVQAVEDNFKTITDSLNVGNAAGYHLIAVTAEYNPGIIGCKGGAVLTIIAQGSEALVDYDEDNDPPKTYTAWIAGVTQEDLPEPYNFEIASKKPFNPFDDSDIPDSDGFKYGVIWAMIEHVAMHHTKMGKPSDLPLITRTNTRFPTLSTNNPDKYTSTLLSAAHTLKIKDTIKANAIMDRITELQASLSGDKSEMPSIPFGAAKTRVYFRRNDQASHISSLREAAGKTQKQVAEESGITTRQYQRIEAGEVKIGKVAYDTAIAISKALGVDVEDLKK